MTHARSRILVSGSMAFDLLLEHDGAFTDALDPAALQHLSVCYNTPSYARAFGGNAVSTGWTLHLMGEKPHILAAVGEDGGEYVEFLSRHGVDVSGIEKHDDCKTATCIICTDDKGHQITYFHDGANARRAWPRSLRPSEIGCAIIAPTIPWLTLDGVRWCAENNVPCFFDPGQRVMQFTPDELRELFKLSAGVFVNAYEAELLSSRMGMTPEKMARETPFLVVTRDADGFILFEEGRSVGLPRCDADEVADPTGAGDAFRAGFMSGYLRGWSLEQCGMLGAAVASFSVESRGVMMEGLDMEKVYARAEKAYGQPLPKL